MTCFGGVFYMFPTFIFGTLSQIAQIGLFFAAAAALVVGMLGLR